MKGCALMCVLVAVVMATMRAYREAPGFVLVDESQAAALLSFLSETNISDAAEVRRWRRTRGSSR